METLRISISMALMLRVPTPLRCCRMPARMASLSLGCFLQPPVKSAAESHTASAKRFMPESFLILGNNVFVNLTRTEVCWESWAGCFDARLLKILFVNSSYQGLDPPPLFFVSVASKGFRVSCKWFRINTCGQFYKC